ncbi:MAG: hypothetical protein HPY66_1725 [Firmicutes bacterium]|nr:hypothetical protein [Bacillota bacterium]
MASVLGLQEQSIMPSKAFIDANFLLAMEGSNHRYHKACRDLVSKLSQKGTRFYISPLVIDEFYFAIISMTLRKKHKFENVIWCYRTNFSNPHTAPSAQ